MVLAGNLLRTNGNLRWEPLPGLLRALRADRSAAGLLPAPELGAIAGGTVLRFIVRIKVVVHGPVREVLAVTLLYLGIDVKHLLVFLELVYQSRDRLERTRRGFSSSRHPSMQPGVTACLDSFLALSSRFQPPLPARPPLSQGSHESKVLRKFILCGTG